MTTPAKPTPANANLYARLFDGLKDPLKTAIETEGRSLGSDRRTLRLKTDRPARHGRSGRR